MADSAPGKNKKIKFDSEKALTTLILIMIAGLAGTIIYAVQAASIVQFFSLAMVGVMVAGAFLFIGGLLGFLFGIPRTLQQDQVAEPASNSAATASEKDERQVNYLVNTNLEQISDWLTKILVGVGLTQLTAIPGKLQQMADLVASGLGTSESNRVFALAIILFFLITGFLFGFLWTRLYLPGALRQADISSLSREVKQVNKKLEELEKQTELDAGALNLVQRQLNPSLDIPAVTQEELNDAIKAASRSVKVQVFSQAQAMRSEHWRTDKAKMELTIPLFKALVESDSEGKFHRNHAQLGYALKDQKKPNWAEAEAELTRAINLRDDAKEDGWLFYEFNRATCRIRQDEAFTAGQASKPEVRERILADLRAAAQGKRKKLVLEDPDIKKWMTQNNLTSTDLA